MHEVLVSRNTPPLKVVSRNTPLLKSSPVTHPFLMSSFMDDSNHSPFLDIKINGINGSKANPGRAPILRTKCVKKIHLHIRNTGTGQESNLKPLDERPMP